MLYEKKAIKGEMFCQEELNLQLLNKEKPRIHYDLLTGEFTKFHHSTTYIQQTF